MIAIEIPGFGALRLQHLAIDFDGTLAIDHPHRGWAILAQSVPVASRRRPRVPGRRPQVSSSLLFPARSRWHPSSLRFSFRSGQLPVAGISIESRRDAPTTDWARMAQPRCWRLPPALRS